MDIKTAIQKAIEGGWNPNWYFSHFSSNDDVVFGDVRKDSEDNPCYYRNLYQILSDPKFWQSLGKAMGWDIHHEMCPVNADRGFVCKCGKENTPRIKWKQNWHSFITELADGGTAEDWFKNL